MIQTINEKALDELTTLNPTPEAEPKDNKLTELLINALQGAEMRQGCTNHSYYAEILRKEILELLQIDTAIQALKDSIEMGLDGGGHTASVEDYGYCEDCQMFFDLWKYGSIEDAGHSNHNWRYVTPEELVNCIADCEESGCFEEQG